MLLFNTLSYLAPMKRETYTIELPRPLREHLENEAVKAGFPNLGSFLRMTLKKATKFKGK